MRKSPALQDYCRVAGGDDGVFYRKSSIADTEIFASDQLSRADAMAPQAACGLYAYQALRMSTNLWRLRNA
jgi:hypothetical protein